MSDENQLQGGSYTVNEKTHERVLVEQTKPVDDIAPAPAGGVPAIVEAEASNDGVKATTEVIKLAVLPTKAAKKSDNKED